MKVTKYFLNSSCGRVLRIGEIESSYPNRYQRYQAVDKKQLSTHREKK